MKKPIKIHYLLVVYAFLCLFVGNLGTLLAVLSVIVAHELGHMFFVYINGGKIESLELSLLGGKIDVDLTGFTFLQTLTVNTGRPD